MAPLPLSFADITHNHWAGIVAILGNFFLSLVQLFPFNTDSGQGLCLIPGSVG